MRTLEFLKKHIQWVLAVLILLLVLSLYLVYKIENQSQYYSALEKHYLEATAQLDQVQNQNDLLSEEKQRLIDEIAQTVVSYNARISELNETISSLNDQLEAPFVKDYLETHGYDSSTALFNTIDLQTPVEGVLGGTMRWIYEESKVLTRNWALVYYEDGHIGGYALLKYTFDENDHVHWELIANDPL